MSSTLTLLPNQSQEPQKLGWFDRFLVRCMPLSPAEEQELYARTLAHQAVIDCETANKKLFEAQTAVKQAEAEEIRKRIARDEAAVKRELDAIKAAKDIEDKCTYQFTAKVFYKNGTQNNCVLMLNLGESKSGKREILAWRAKTSSGSSLNVVDATKSFFRTTKIYTQVVLPWLHGTITTDQVRKWKGTKDQDGSKGSWVEFPLGE